MKQEENAESGVCPIWVSFSERFIPADFREYATQQTQSGRKRGNHADPSERDGMFVSSCLLAECHEGVGTVTVPTIVDRRGTH